MVEKSQPLEPLCRLKGDVKLKVGGSFTIVICYTVGDLPAQFIELFATFVEVFLLLPLLSHRGEESLDGGVEFVPQLGRNDLQSCGYLQRVDAVDVV